jgi:hypothetical protein
MHEHLIGTPATVDPRRAFLKLDFDRFCEKGEVNCDDVFEVPFFPSII